MSTINAPDRATHTPSPSRRITLTEAAEIAGVHTVTIRRYIKSGRLTGYRIGPRMLRIDADELEAAFRPTLHRTEPSTSADIHAERLAAYVERVVAEAPPLTDEQRDHIVGLLQAGGAK